MATIFNALNRVEEGFRFYSYLGVFFVLGYFALGPFIHELGHLLFLEVARCSYFLEPGWNVYTGFRAGLEIECVTSSHVQLFFYISGYLTTLTSALTAFKFSQMFDGSNERVISIIGVGMLVSIVSSITVKGDVYNALRMLGLESFTGKVEIFVVVVLLVLGLFEAERHFD